MKHFTILLILFFNSYVYSAQKTHFKKDDCLKIDLVQQLHKAAKEGDIKKMEATLKLGEQYEMDANCYHKGQTPLHIVGTVEAAQFLLKSGAQILPNKDFFEKPLWRHVCYHIVYYDKKNTTLNCEYYKRQQKRVITFFAKKEKRTEIERIQLMWNTMVKLYNNKKRLEFSQILPDQQAYCSMMHELLHRDLLPPL